MIALDHSLLADARKAATDANIHRIRQMIFAYEQAVILHNTGQPAHSIYQDRYEMDLRRFVAQQNQNRNALKRSA
jgi:hypothetical protein